MKRPKPFRQFRTPGQRGFISVVGLLFLFSITMLAIAMYRSGGLQERMSGNLREKARAFEAAQSALQYGEWWLSQSNRGTGTACTGVLNANNLAQMQVCSNALASVTSLPWSARADYLPPSMSVAAGGGLAAGGDINYVAMPSLYISYLGLSSDGLSLLYRVSAVGYGGSSSTAAVLQSTYKLSSGVKDLGGQ
jgi:type IV pilus assembly protein PilX